MVAKSCELYRKKECIIPKELITQGRQNWEETLKDANQKFAEFKEKRPLQTDNDITIFVERIKTYLNKMGQDTKISSSDRIALMMDGDQVKLYFKHRLNGKFIILNIEDTTPLQRTLNKLKRDVRQNAITIESQSGTKVSLSHNGKRVILYRQKGGGVRYWQSNMKSGEVVQAQVFINFDQFYNKVLPHLLDEAFGKNRKKIPKSLALKNIYNALSLGPNFNAEKTDRQEIFTVTIKNQIAWLQGKDKTLQLRRQKGGQIISFPVFYNFSSFYNNLGPHLDKYLGTNRPKLQRKQVLSIYRTLDLFEAPIAKARKSFIATVGDAHSQFYQDNNIQGVFTSKRISKIGINIKKKLKEIDASTYLWTDEDEMYFHENGEKSIKLSFIRRGRKLFTLEILKSVNDTVLVPSTKEQDNEKTKDHLSIPKDKILALLFKQEDINYQKTISTNPQHLNFFQNKVKEWIKKYRNPESQNQIGKQVRDALKNIRKNGEKDLRMIYRECLINEVPLSIAFVAIVESHWKNHPTNASGAAGRWQFIKKTGIDQGLIINKTIDERMDKKKSTQAAIKYLKRLFLYFKNKYKNNGYDINKKDLWHMSILAYNRGQGNITKDLKNSKGDSLKQIYQLEARRLKLESEGKEDKTQGSLLENINYLAKFYAIQFILKTDLDSDKNSSTFE